MNPTSVAKQQRQQEMETIQEEVTRLRELVRSLQDGGSLVQSQEDSIVPNLGLGLPPSKEVLGKIIGSNHHTPASVLVFRCFSDHFDLDSDREPPWTRWAAPVSGAVTADVSSPWCPFRTSLLSSLKTSSDFGLCLSYRQFIFVSVSFFLLWILMETPAAAWDWKLSADLSDSLWDICTYLQTRGFHLQDKRKTIPLFFRCNRFIHKRKNT